MTLLGGGADNCDFVYSCFYIRTLYNTNFHVFYLADILLARYSGEFRSQASWMGLVGETPFSWGVRKPRIDFSAAPLTSTAPDIVKSSLDMVLNEATRALNPSSVGRS